MPAKTQAPAEDEWEIVQDEPRIRVKLDEGDEFVGFYEGKQHVVDPNLNKEGEHDEWDAYNFIGISPSSLEGERVAIYETAHLRQALDQLDPKAWIVRIRRTRDISVKSQPSPMATYEVARKRA